MKKNILLIILFLIFQLCQVLKAYKILVYSQTLTRSHVILNAKVAEALASDGHNVTILEVEYMEPLTEFEGSSAKGVKKISVRTDLNKAKETIQGRLTEIYFKEATAWSLITGYKNDEDFQNTINEGTNPTLYDAHDFVVQLDAQSFNDTVFCFDSTKIVSNSLFLDENTNNNSLNDSIKSNNNFVSGEVQSEIIGRCTSIIVEFYSDWCGHCRAVETYNNLWKGIDTHISTLIVLFESNTNSLVGAQLLLDLSGYADKVVARRCVNNALANALQIKDFPTFAVFRRGERSPAYIAELRRLLLNEFEQLLRNDSKETSKRSMNKFSSRKKFASGSENIEQFCSNFPQICKRAYFVSELDLLKSARIALFNDVQMIGGENITGQNLRALYEFVDILANYYPHRTIHPQLRETEINGSQNSREINEFNEKDNIENDQKNPFPISEEWEHCKGSSPVLRGYTCGLWTLFHVLTVNGYRNGQKDTSFDPLRLLLAIRDWVLSFFACDHCRVHFRKMTTKTARIETSINREEDVFLYLWKAHNLVNSRLHGRETEDPKFPKYQFPPHFLCQDCRREINKEFDEDKIKNFLLLYYSDIRPIGRKGVEEEDGEEVEDKLE
uniref:Sulfhydryl oxidase n=1 Tax=Meloidogyne javanica TaxID=6303 RepID=A0A915N4Y7_MELJA